MVSKYTGKEQADTQEKNTVAAYLIDRAHDVITTHKWIDEVVVNNGKSAERANQHAPLEIRVERSNACEMGTLEVECMTLLHPRESAIESPTEISVGRYLSPSKTPNRCLRSIEAE